MEYAWIQNGTVVNIISLSPSNAKDFACAIALNGMAVQAGDRYENGAFYRNGEKLMTPLEEAEMILDELTGGVDDVRKE